MMNHSHKILLNTIALYGRTVVSAIVSVVSTKIVLDVLGVDSFGVYNLIAGVVVLLSFLNGALMISTQRFLSISIGEKNFEKLNGIFNVSLMVHFFIGLFIALFFKILQPFLFDGFLNISSNLVDQAESVYNIMIFTSFCTIIMIPYSASINAREDMVFFSASEILMLLFRLLAAVLLLYLEGNLLITYTYLMLLSVFVNVMAKYIWCKFKYKETRISIHLMKDKEIFSGMVGFIGWNTIGALAVLIRNQGSAIVLNLFFGTVVNAAYGVATQVNSLVLSFSLALTNVFAPSIIQSKGEGNDKKMLNIAIFSSKLSFFLSSLIALPLLLFMPEIIKIWLKEIPLYTVEFCRLIILSFLILQFFPGINRAIYAHGDIKWYQIFIFFIIVLIIPVSFFLFKKGMSPSSIFYAIIFSQLLLLFFTVFWAKKSIQLNAKSFLLKSVLLPFFIFVMVLLLAFLFNSYIQYHLFIKFFLISIFSITIYGIFFMNYVFTYKEKSNIKKLYGSVLKKIKS